MLINSFFHTIDMAKNSRLRRCKVCGADCFKLSIKGELRHWWHEIAELDTHHEALPLQFKRCKNGK
jgi:hypothetical protein